MRFMPTIAVLIVAHLLPAMLRAEDAITKATQTKVDLSFTDVPLADVISQLQKIHKISVFVDAAAIAKNKIKIDATVTLQAKGIALGDGLSLILGGYGLDWTINRGVMFITTTDIAAATRSIRFYPVKDLLNSAGEMSDLLTVLHYAVRGDARPVTAYGGLLLVNGSQATHSRVRSTLRKLRAALKP